MSSSHEDVTFSLKVMINKEKTKVLFAEAGSDFVDVLLSFLTLPLGTIVRVLENHYGDEVPVIGSLNTLYSGLSNLGNVHFQSKSCKQMLLNPRSSFTDECCNLKLDISDAQPTKYFSCEGSNCGVYCNKKVHIGMYYDTTRCHCGKSLNKEIMFSESVKAGARVFTAEAACFIISDDMRMAPNVAGSIMKTLNDLGVMNTDGATSRRVTFGFNEIMELLKGMMVSRSPPTDIILGQTKRCSATPKTEPTGTLLPKTEKLVALSDSKKMILKATIQKSTNKLCFVQADEDFVDFLFSLLTIPLGGVEHLLGSDTCLTNVDNLYRSLANINGIKHLKSKDVKARLLNPKIPYGYISGDQILPLTQEPVPTLFWHPRTFRFGEPYLSTASKDTDGREGGSYMVSSITSPKHKGNFLQGCSMFMVTDDMTITPLCISTTLSKMNAMGIPFSDVKEVELQIGLEEALTILKASLTSTSALTNSLINPFLSKKRPKLENKMIV